MQELFLFVICICATTLGAISGIGGGVIIKPVMDAVSGMSVSTISFCPAARCFPCPWCRCCEAGETM